MRAMGMSAVIAMLATHSVIAASDLQIEGTISEQMRMDAVDAFTEHSVKPLKGSFKTFTTARGAGNGMLETLTYRIQQDGKLSDILPHIVSKLRGESIEAFQIVRPSRSVAEGADDFVVTTTDGFSAHVTKSKRGAIAVTVRYKLLQ